MMEHKYWLQRERASVESAQMATNSEARLIHLELAGRYKLLAVKVANQKRRQAKAAAIV